MFDVRRLRVLDEVVRCGSLSAAAAGLSYTTSAVSQQITALERDVGVALLVRGPTGARPTPAGMKLLEHAGAILAAVAAAERDVAAAASGRANTLRVASFASAAAAILPGAVARLRAALPQVAVELIAADPDDGVALVGDDAAEAALITEVPGEPPMYPRVLTVPVYDDEFFIALPRRHRLANSPQLPIAALSGEQWIVSSATGTCPDTRVFRMMAEQAGFTPEVNFRSEDYATVQGLVAAGMGVSLVPSLAATSVHPGVVMRRVAGRRPVRRVGVAVASRPEPASALAAFVSLVKSEGERMRVEDVYSVAARPYSIA